MKRKKLSALVLGNANYPDAGILKNSVNDAKDISNKLQEFGFEVIKGVDCTIIEMKEKLAEFTKLLKSHDVGLFFFAGHGLQVEGHNYLLAADTDIAGPNQVKYSSLPLDLVLDEMAASEVLTKIIVLDACRNELGRAWYRDVASRGLASVYAPEGTIIGFATSPGETASDGTGRNGAYTQALLQHIEAEDYPIEMMFKRVRNTVAATTGGKQTTWEHTSLAGEFYFNLGINNLVDEYNESALADGLFEIDGSKPSHVLIEALKSCNWYVQNPALVKLDGGSVQNMEENCLFVVGRNIYQAACGSSGEANAFIVDFVNRTANFPEKKRRAILDGMLFEVFFDPKGSLRPRIKGEYFNEVFDLQARKELKDSFDFIANTLVAARADFPVVPGSGHSLDVSVSFQKKKGGYLIDGVFVAGKNVLHIPEKDDDEFDGPYAIRKLSCDRFIQGLSEQFAVPQRLINMTFSPAEAENEDKLLIHRGWGILIGR